jgi:hypothetical protein
MVVGGCLLLIGYSASAFVPNIEYLYLTYGLIVGRLFMSMTEINHISWVLHKSVNLLQRVFWTRTMTPQSLFLWVTECLLLNANSAILQLYHGGSEYFSMRWWWGSLCTRRKHMSLRSDILSWFQTNKSLLLVINVANTTLVGVVIVGIVW